MWSDNESENDYLNYAETADLIVEVLGKKELRPLSVGVFGGWGAGKSSMVRLVEKKLKDDDDVILISFDAWLFQSYDDARAALLDTIGGALRDAAHGNESLREKVESLLGRVNKLRALGLIAELGAAAVGLPAFGVINAGIGAAAKVIDGDGGSEELNALGAVGTDIAAKGNALVASSEAYSPPEEVRAFRREFQELLDEMGKTLVVVVDNLDRCLPRDAIHTLEAIRLFLFVPQTAFVIAADEEMIRHAVSEHYGARQTRLISDYLDKFVQIPVRVPRAGFAEMRSYLIMLLATSPFDSSDLLTSAQLDAVNARLMEHLRTTWQSIELKSSELIAAADAVSPLTGPQKAIITNSFRLAETLAPQLVETQRVSGNPRIVKRMLNVVRLRSQIARARNMPLGEATIAKLVLFERCASAKATGALLNFIAASKDGCVSEIATVEEAIKNGDVPNLPAEWQDDSRFISEWAALDPKLGASDLRPAAYLARDFAPTKMANTDFSPQAESALRVLAVAEKTSSPALKAAVQELPADERLAVQDKILKQLDQESVWTKMPPGYIGAHRLADISEPCAEALVAFMKQHIPEQPKWLKMRLKEASWWEAE